MPILSKYKQRTPEWLDAHIGKVTGSRAHDFLSSDKTRETLLKKIVAEHYTGFVGGKQFTGSARTEEGNKAEPAMIKAYEDRYSGFVEVKHDDSYFYHDKLHWLFAYSPDGLIDDAGMIEGKAPDADNHIGLLLGIDSVKPMYESQMKLGMWELEREWCDFIDYCECCHGNQLWIKRYTMTDVERKMIDITANTFANRVQESLDKLNTQSCVLQEILQ